MPGATRITMTTLSRARLRDAEILFHNHRYQGAFYLCGYAIEMRLKARICTTLKWPDYETGSGYTSFKTHAFEVLLKLSGRTQKIKLLYMAEWSIVSGWSPELRYEPLGTITRVRAEEMIECTRTLLKAI